MSKISKSIFCMKKRFCFKIVVLMQDCRFATIVMRGLLQATFVMLLMMMPSFPLWTENFCEVFLNIASGNRLHFCRFLNLKPSLFILPIDMIVLPLNL